MIYEFTFAVSLVWDFPNLHAYLRHTSVVIWLAVSRKITFLRMYYLFVALGLKKEEEERMAKEGKRKATNIGKLLT